jgi:hypothetical protein
MAHRGFRAEFGRLATAAAAVRDDAHAALIDDQIELVMHLLHHHHTAEDTSLWPVLVDRAPAAREALARLEEQHEDMDPLFTRIENRSIPVAERAATLAELHDVLNAHLDEEERNAVPLIAAHLSAKEWEADGEKVMATLDKKKLPLIFGWLASCSTPEQASEALKAVPLLARVLFRLVWWPGYQKRFRALYGATAPVGPNPRRVLS